MRLDTYATDPGGAKRLIAWNQHVAESSLSPALRALVETRVSQINGCAFCLAMHTDEGRQAGMAQTKLDTVAAWRDDSSFTDEERAALDLAEAMTRIADGGRVGDAVWDRAAACFDDAQLAALVQVVAIINAFNRLNVATERSAQDYYAFATARA